MRILGAISRLVTGLVFILSGFIKAMDPIGGALKIDEYLKAFKMGFLEFVSLPSAVALACAEFLIGVCVLKGIRMRFFASAALVFTSFFTLLTLYSAIFNPVQDCGCFGEALHLTNWQTFYKNIVLLACASVLFSQRKKFRPIAAPVWKNIYVACYAIFILGISSYAIAFLPQIDFGQFKAGTDIVASLAEKPEMEYHMTLIYSKDGVEKEFTLENLPDSTWSFVDSHTKLISGSESSAGAFNFVLRNEVGYEITEEIISSDRPLFFISIYNPDKISDQTTDQINTLYYNATALGADFYLLNATSEEFPSIVAPALQTDYKTALALNRSNGGLTYINDGIVAEKWSKRNYPEKMEKILGEDSEILTANVVIREQIFGETCLVIVLFMVLIVRFISKRIYFKSLANLQQESEENSAEEITVDSK